MIPPSVSGILDDFERSGKRVRRTVVILGPGGEDVEDSSVSKKILSVQESFNLRQYSELVETYLPYAYRKELIEGDDLYILTRAMLILKRRTEVLGMLKLNKEIMIHHRVLMFEYIVLCAREGDFEAMSEGIGLCETRFGEDSIHCKILQALIYSNSNTDDYIRRMEEKYQIHAEYEILRAAYATRKRTLIRRYVSEVSDSPRNNILQIKAYIFLADYKSSIDILNKINPSSLSSSQAKELVRISLQIQPDTSVSKWAEIAGMSPNSILNELARNQLSTGIIENDFSKGFKGLESLLQYEKPTRTQILKLIRTDEDYRVIFEKFMSIAGTHGFMLQMIVEFAVKYSFKEISLTALIRLESLMLCDLDSGAYQKHYVEGVKNSGDIYFMARAYDLLEYIPTPIPLVFEFASYFSKLSSQISFDDKPSSNLDEGSIEQLVLKRIIQQFSAPVPPQYDPIPSLALVVNNSLRFGGAERQVVRCLANSNFSKELVVWNIGANSPENSFITEVQDLDVEIFDYSKSVNDSEELLDPQIQELLDLIPSAPPMNPGISQKITHLIQLIHNRKPTTLHLWQDTTNILGAIAGLICGVPRIVMSARSLPPFKLPSSTFPNKGPNYYYNNRFVRMNYQDILLDKRVYLCHNSQNGLEKYAEWLGGFKSQMMVLRNGFDLSDFTPVSDNKMQREAFNIGVVFRFVDVKQPLLWLDVAKLIIKRSKTKVMFTMVGDGPLLEESIRYSKHIGIDNFVDFKGYREDVVQILENFDLFLLTSIVEGLPNVLIEAQAMGLPVVSTDAGGARETFVDGKSGVLVKIPTVENLAEAVLRVVNDKDFQSSASVVAQDYVSEHFSLKSMHSELEKILFEGL